MASLALDSPFLRFPDFDESWKELALDKAATFSSSKRVYLSDYVEVGIPFYRGKEISELKRGETPQGILYITEDSYDRYKEKYGVPEIGDILITAVGTLGNVYRITRSDPFYFKDGNLIWLRNLKQEPAFVEVLLECKNDDVLKSSIGSSQRALTMVELKKLKFHFPTLPEQRKIADFLTAVDGRIGQLSQKKALLEDYKKGVMQQLFTQALRFKDDHGNDFPEWEEKKFTDVLETTSPRGFQIQSSEILTEGRFKVVDQGKALIAGYCDNSEKVMQTSPVIVYGDHTTTIKYVDFEFVVGADGTQILVSKDPRSDLKYLYYNLAQNNVSQEGYKRHFSILKGILMQIPSPAEQTKIANFLTALDRKIEIVSSQITGMQTWKKGLLQQMFV